MCRFKTCLLLKVWKWKTPKRANLKVVSAEKKGRRHWIYGPVYGKLQHLHVNYCMLNIWVITENEFGNGVANVYSACYLITWYETCYYAILLQRYNIILKRYKTYYRVSETKWHVLLTGNYSHQIYLFYLLIILLFSQRFSYLFISPFYKLHRASPRF